MTHTQTNGHPVRILLVEDDNNIGRIIEYAMRELGIPYEFVAVLSAEEGLERWAEQPFDVLITDYNLRGMNGVRLIKTLHERGYYPPALIVTAYDSAEVRQAAAEAAVDGYITKPFFLDELIERIKQLIPATYFVQERAING